PRLIGDTGVDTNQVLVIGKPGPQLAHGSRLRIDGADPCTQFEQHGGDVADICADVETQVIGTDQLPVKYAPLRKSLPPCAVHDMVLDPAKRLVPAVFRGQVLDPVCHLHDV